MSRLAPLEACRIDSERVKTPLEVLSLSCQPKPVLGAKKKTSSKLKPRSNADAKSDKSRKSAPLPLGIPRKGTNPSTPLKNPTVPKKATTQPPKSVVSSTCSARARNLLALEWLEEERKLAEEERRMAEEETLQEKNRKLREQKLKTREELLKQWYDLEANGMIWKIAKKAVHPAGTDLALKWLEEQRCRNAAKLSSEETASGAAKTPSKGKGSKHSGASKKSPPADEEEEQEEV